jgi:hypothetical protein
MAFYDVMPFVISTSGRCHEQMQSVLSRCITMLMEYMAWLSQLTALIFLGGSAQPNIMGSTKGRRVVQQWLFKLGVTTSYGSGIVSLVMWVQ